MDTTYRIPNVLLTLPSPTRWQLAIKPRQLESPQPTLGKACTTSFKPDRSMASDHSFGGKRRLIVKGKTEDVGIDQIPAEQFYSLAR
ncbi:hypothetical protein [Burkholderia ubonensis]|uniref:hypothetical protein n=1 Tax=Burkholderia ubonensis TaxID=101571 RepID=UPI000B1414A9|nr:hypothetical protein [Burkholderia ubonensis]